MRKRISEVNMIQKFDITDEYIKLNSLFCNGPAFGYARSSGNSSLSLSFRDILEELFLNWNLRGSSLTVKEMLHKLGISDKDMKAGPSEDQILDYVQFVMNACVFVLAEVRDKQLGYYCDPEAGVFYMICSKSREIMDRFSAEMEVVGHELAVIYKNDVVTAVSLQNPDIKNTIVEYQKIDNRGDLVRKGEVLCTLYKKLEPHERQFRGTELWKLYSDTTELLDKIGARHALKEQDYIECKIMAMDVSEREKWYDRTFQMILACIAAIPYLGFKNEINELKRYGV